MTHVIWMLFQIKSTSNCTDFTPLIGSRGKSKLLCSFDGKARKLWIKRVRNSAI